MRMVGLPRRMHLGRLGGGGGMKMEGPSLVTPPHGYVRMFGLLHRMHFGDFVGVWVGVKE